MSEEERRATAAAAASSAGARNVDIGASTDDDLNPPTAATGGGLHPTVGQPEQAAPSIQQLLLYFTQQNQRMYHLMTMMQHDRPEVKAESCERPPG